MPSRLPLFHVLQNDSQIPEAFGDALGGLLSVVASNVRVSITTEAAGGNVVTSDLHSGGRVEIAADPNKQVILGLCSQPTFNQQHPPMFPSMQNNIAPQYYWGLWLPLA